MGNEFKQKIIKDLVTLWKSAENKKFYFEKILKRIDKLIIYKIGILKQQFKQLSNVPNQDLYNTAIFGVYRALDSVKDKDSGATIQARILSYIKEEIRKTFMPHKKEIVTENIEKWENEIESKEPEFTNIEYEELQEIVNKLIKNFQLPKEDFDILLDHVLNNTPYKKIAKDLGVHYTTVANRIKNAKKLLRKAMEGKI